jgi:hypothetical protein
MRARTEEGGNYCRLSHVMGNGPSTIPSCRTELSGSFFLLAVFVFSVLFLGYLTAIRQVC